MADLRELLVFCPECQGQMRLHKLWADKENKPEHTILEFRCPSCYSCCEGSLGTGKIFVSPEKGNIVEKPPESPF